MKRLSLFIMLSVAVLLTACNGIDNVGPDVETVAAKQKTSTIIRDVNVSKNEAIDVANRFVRSNSDGNIIRTKSAFASTKMIRSSETIREDGNNLMYVFNYQGGGFVIVGSTRNYYPILAYSDEGSFVLQEDMGPVDVWLDETKVSIKNSNSLDNDTKAQMQNLWSMYDGTLVDPAQELLSARRPQTRSTGEDACWDRIDSLQAEHGDEGWTYLPVSQVEELFTDLGFSNDYATICYCASQNHSELNETVIGYRYPAVNQVGPLLTTEWHQGSPYNSLCPNQYPAGSEVIATAQIMRYYAHPDTLMWEGNTITWADIPVSPNTVPNKIPHLIRRLGQLYKENYGASGTSTFIAYVLSGMMSKGYLPIDAENETNYRNQIFNNHRPVLMIGTKSNDPLSEHYAWVCDGVRQAVYNEIQYYTENQPYGAGQFTQGMYTYYNPGLSGQPVGNPIYRYHMNWGLPGGTYNGWFTANYIYCAPIDYNYNRINYYIYVNPNY
ncbi:MAG: C10 family peptidase [Bacteroidales bacterium]|nr:C10 family peptidase [Bacteroidales bacterium]